MIRFDKADLFCFGPPVYFRPPVINYMLLYSTSLCKKIARAPGGRKKYKLTELGGGGRNRIDPKKQMKKIENTKKKNWRRMEVKFPHMHEKPLWRKQIYNQHLKIIK